MAKFANRSVVCSNNTDCDLVRKIQTRRMLVHHLYHVSKTYVNTPCGEQYPSTYQPTPKPISLIKRPDRDIGTTLYELLRDVGQAVGVSFECFHKTSVRTESELGHLEKLCSVFTHTRNVRTAVRHSKEGQPSCTSEYVPILL